MHILFCATGHHFSEHQFGFVGGRNTSLALSLVTDVVAYANTNGSCVYACSLDAEGAVDNIPHSILFQKTIGIIPDLCWRTLVMWYKSLNVVVKWNGHFSEPICVLKGTRQGGLSSPFLFNIVYQDMIVKLNSMPCGISIQDKKFNAFCYADDILITSLTPCGLQMLMDASSQYITSHGLRFNPHKTKCISLGKQHLLVQPHLTLNGIGIKQFDKIDYLGAVLSNNSHDHVEARIQACRRAFYSLQGAGLCVSGACAQTITKIWNMVLRPVLLYGLSSFSLSRKSINELESTQGKLLKSAFGLGKYCKNTEFLISMGIQKISTSIDIARIDMLKLALKGTSACTDLYSRGLADIMCGSNQLDSKFMAQCRDVFKNCAISACHYLVDDNYALGCKKHIRTQPRSGITDSINYLLSSQQSNYVQLVNMLLSPF